MWIGHWSLVDVLQSSAIYTQPPQVATRIMGLPKGLKIRSSFGVEWDWTSEEIVQGFVSLATTKCIAKSFADLLDLL